jgi:hypothetical protein
VHFSNVTHGDLTRYTLALQRILLLLLLLLLLLHHLAGYSVYQRDPNIVLPRAHNVTATSEIYYKLNEVQYQ